MAVPPRLTRRSLLLTAGQLSLTAFALSACGGATSSSAPTSATTTTATTSAQAAVTSATATGTVTRSPEGKPVPVVWMHSFSADQQLRLKDILVVDVKRDLPGIALRIISSLPHYTDLQILIAGGSQPDVTMNQGLNPLGMFADPSAYIARDKFDLVPYNPVLLGFMKWQGVLWSLPASVGGDGPIWVFNETRFKNTGVPYPPDRWDDPTWTWDELVKRTRALTSTKGGITTYGFGPMWGWQPHPRPWGAQWLKEDLKTVTADTPEMLQAFTVWQDMFVKYGVLPKPGEKPGYNTTQDPILSGASAIKPTGAWAYSSYMHVPQVAWALAPVPRGAVTACDQTYFGVSIVKGAKHPDGAWEFARWLATTPDYTLVRQVPPALPGLFDRWVPAVFGDQAAERRAHLIKEGLAFAAPSDAIKSAPQTVAMSKAVSALILKLSTGQTTPADMLRQAQTQLQALAGTP